MLIDYIIETMNEMNMFSLENLVADFMKYTGEEQRWEYLERKNDSLRILLLKDNI